MADPTPVELAGGTSTTATTTATFAAQAAGSILILSVASDDYRTTSGSGRPESTGWTYIDGQQGNLGCYVWYQVAVGSETSVQYTIGSGANSAYTVTRLDNIASASFIGVEASNAGSIGTNIPSHAAASVTPTAGDRWCVVATVGSTGNATSGPYTWSGAYGKLSERYTTSGYRPGVTVGTVTKDGGTSTTGTVTFASATNVNQGMSIVQAFRVASGFDGAVSGTVTVTSAASGTVQASRPVTGAVPAVTVVTGSPTSRQGVAGSVAVVSGATGMVAALRPATGTTPVVSTVTGAPAALYPVTGTIPVISGASGAVNLAGGLAASGTVVVQSTVTGTVQSRQGVAGTVPVSSAAAGAVQAVLPVTGAAAVVSAVSGAVTALRPVAGVVPVVSTVAGAVDVAGSLALSGTVVVLSSTAGAVQSRQGVTGAVGAVTTVAGAAGSRQGVAGTVPVVSDAQGSPAAVYLVGGMVVVVSTVTGSVGAVTALDATPVYLPRLLLAIPVSTAALTVPLSRVEVNPMSYTRHDTGPDLVMTLTSTPTVAFTGAAVEVHLRKPSGTTVTIPAGQVAFDPDARTVTVAWAGGDLNETGAHQIEAQVTYSNSQVQTFPSAGFTVERELA